MNRKFVLGVLAFLVFVFVLQWNAPSKFVWQPTYLHTDRQPFGCAVFDSLVQSSLSQDYSVTNKTLPQLLSEGKQPRAIMVNAINFTPTVTDLKAMKQLLRRGNKIMLVVHDYRPESRCVDVIPVWIDSYGTFSPRMVQISLQQMGDPMDTLWWADQKPYQKRMFRVYYPLMSGGFEYRKRIECDTLLQYRNLETEPADTQVMQPTTEGWQPKIISMRIGKGTLLLNAVPQLFTNYGILDKEINPLIFRTISQFGNMEVVRTQAYLPKSSNGSNSPLSYFLEKKPLRWAVYLALFGLLLFFVFTARRRQRVIPVVTPPENKSLEFVKLIGTLYHQHHDNRDILTKKCNYFAETIRRSIMADIMADEEQRETVTLITNHTGLPPQEVENTLLKIRKLKDAAKVSDSELKELVDAMDKILNQL